MEKLILDHNKNDYYILEVNDKGDTIEFDLTDMRLPKKIMDASDKMLKLHQEYQTKRKELENNKDILKRAEGIIELDEQNAKEMRKTLDSFLGEGACQKIFGDKEQFGQYIALINALKPHFEKIKIKGDKAKQKLANKYMQIDKEVI